MTTIEKTADDAVREGAGDDGTPLLEVRDLHVEFHTRDGVAEAVNGVNYSVDAGETLAVLGESGSGKSVTAQAIMGILDMPPGKIPQGQILFRGEDMLTMSGEERRKIRGRRIAMIFQDALSSLNPVLSVGYQLGEMFRVHQGLMNRWVAEILDGSGIGQPLGKSLHIVLDLRIQTADHVLGIGKVLPGPVAHPATSRRAASNSTPICAEARRASSMLGASATAASNSWSRRARSGWRRRATKTPQRWRKVCMGTVLSVCTASCQALWNSSSNRTAAPRSRERTATRRACSVNGGMGNSGSSWESSMGCVLTALSPPVCRRSSTWGDRFRQAFIQFGPSRVAAGSA
ncbi:hypothetical protein SANTM175S_05029 [Streptomyces antimycoticus]